MTQIPPSFATTTYQVRHSHVPNNNVRKSIRVIRMVSLLRASCAAFAIGIACSSPMEVAIAQPSLATLTGVTVSDVGGGTKVLLAFSQGVSDFSVEGNDSARTTLSFDAAAMGAGINVPAVSKGLLKAIEFNQRGSHLMASFVGNGPIHVEATGAAGRAISVSITAAQGVSTVAPTPVSTQVPPFVEPKPGEDEFEVVPLKYADLSEVVGVLSAGQIIKPNDNFTPQEPAFGSSGFGNNGNPAGTNVNVAMPPPYNPNPSDPASTAYGQSIDESIGIDRRLNAIILRGPPERVARLKTKIAQLDVPVQSVVLETVFVELTENGAHNVGFDFNNGSGEIALASFQGGGQANNGSSGVSGYSGSYALQAALYAQVQKGEGRIVSRPRISAQSGASAKIITGDALPILTSIALSGVNAVSQQVQYVNVGVTLQIAPRVSVDGYVTSHVFAEVSSVTGTSQGYPTISQREASTSATVKDGEYFVIGGLTQDNYLKSHSRVPGLGDIPLAGDLFKLHQETHAKTELYIVVTPHIVRSGDSDIARAQVKKFS